MSTPAFIFLIDPSMKPRILKDGFYLSPFFGFKKRKILYNDFRFIVYFNKGQIGRRKAKLLNEKGKHIFFVDRYEKINEYIERPKINTEINISLKMKKIIMLRMLLSLLSIKKYRDRGFKKSKSLNEFYFDFIDNVKEETADDIFKTFINAIYDVSMSMVNFETSPNYEYMFEPVTNKQYLYLANLLLKLYRVQIKRKMLEEDIDDKRLSKILLLLSLGSIFGSLSGIANNGLIIKSDFIEDKGIITLKDTYLKIFLRLFSENCIHEKRNKISKNIYWSISLLNKNEEGLDELYNHIRY